MTSQSGKIQVHFASAGLLRKLHPLEPRECSWKSREGMDFLWDFFGVSLGQASDRNEHFSLQAVGKLFTVLAEPKQAK